MIIPSQAVRIVIATKPVDFRKGHDGLAALAERDLGLDPHSGVIIVFRAKRGDRIKVLLWDGSGMVMRCRRPSGLRSTRLWTWPCRAPISSAVRSAGLPFYCVRVGAPFIKFNLLTFLMF